ncbi:MHYT domain-containing protein [Paenibacillus daejeonensis]|uniref:MHYT domain-containing protein n=1 Tax=Paenibacillus daejeonensis TaxID=135193 RepID=UPI00035CB2F0|nr:MHYT domain-containing protein [Paenibacillus daejeonensis]
MEHVHGSHDTVLVLFSYVIAVAASYTVLDLGGRIITSRGSIRWGWLVFGAAIMGMGIWSMHFVGMLAFSLPVRIPYDMGLVILSVFAAILGSLLALISVSRPQLPLGRLLVGGVTLAAGISCMHYIGMAAMQVNITYDPLLFTLSIIIALVASIAALWLAFYFRQAGGRHEVWKKLGSGLIMGTAIVGMHYTGMLAAHFELRDPSQMSTGMLLDQTSLAYTISIGTLLTLGLSMLSIVISNRFSQKDNQLQEQSDEIQLKNQELLLLNHHLEDLVAKRTAELEQAHDEAIEANKIKSQFLANMSHELRTPLNAIIGYSEMLMEEAEDLGQQELMEDLDKIRRSGNHLLTLINDILDISKIEADKMETYIEAFALEDLVKDVESTVLPLIRANGNILEIACASGTIVGDQTKLKQVLLNLLSNAAKFTSEGKVRLRVVEASREAAGYLFEVEDSGIGIEPEQLDKLFQPFTQADASTTRLYGGTGLGLTISKHFVEMMEGDMQVRSVPGQGSTFQFWIPAAPALQTEKIHVS